MTTAIALLSLTIVPHALVSDFGLTAAIGTAIAFFISITVLPALASLLLGWTGSKEASDRSADRIFEATSGVCRRRIGRSESCAEQRPAECERYCSGELPSGRHCRRICGAHIQDL
jgi:multidrug efflux pump subunit AcrB